MTPTNTYKKSVEELKKMTSIIPPPPGQSTEVYVDKERALDRLKSHTIALLEGEIAKFRGRLEATEKSIKKEATPLRKAILVGMSEVYTNEINDLIKELKNIKSL